MYNFLVFVFSNPLAWLWFIVLQLLLCTRKRKWFGLVLPVILTVFTLSYGLYLVAVKLIIKSWNMSYSEIGIAISYTLIPALVLFIIYAIIRRFKEK